jgi:hypothetical protein
MGFNSAFKGLSQRDRFPAMKTHSAYSSKISVSTQQTTRCHNPDTQHQCVWYKLFSDKMCEMTSPIPVRSHFMYILQTPILITLSEGLYVVNVLTLLLSVTSTAKLRIIIPCFSWANIIREGSDSCSITKSG